MYTLGREISVDEGMIAYRGRVSYLQYIPKKPTKFGIKVWMVAESKSGYVPNYIMYTGKLSEENCDPTLEGQNQGYKVVMALVKPYLNKGHHVYFDNLFTSLKLLEDLHQQKTYATGTVRQNRKGYPNDLKTAKLKTGDFIEQQKGSVIATKWHDKKEVTLMTTITDGNTDPLTINRRSKIPDKREVQMPQVVHSYNKNMCGVDLSDQLRQYYSCGRRSKKYWKYMFWFIVDIAINNAYIASKGQLDDIGKQFYFRVALSKQLIDGFSARIRTAQKRTANDDSVVAKKKAVKALKGVLLLKPGSQLRHESATFETRKRACAWCKKIGSQTPKGRIRETTHGCITCNENLHPGVCFQRYHDNYVFAEAQVTEDCNSAEIWERFRSHVIHISTF